MIRKLIGINVGWLRQARTLVDQMDDAAFATSPKGFEPHRVGSHLRHVLEFYECFLDGLPTGRIDYDNRQRDVTVEKSRRAAVARIDDIIQLLEHETANSDGAAISVRMENAEADAFLMSSVERELQALSSHTIHHFALIAVTLRLHGCHIDPDFGMSPSTLRYQAAQSIEAA